MNVCIVAVDYTNEVHAKDLVTILNAYAQDDMGGGQPLSEHVQQSLPRALALVPGAFSFLCYVENEPAGLINCFTGFSTFKCQPLVNIHDVAVINTRRGLGLSQKLLQAVEDEAKKRGCCKVTLEVLSGNEVAKKAYAKFGFKGYQLMPAMGGAQFWEKSL